MSLDDETISKIAKAIRLERISNTWKDPKKAQAVGVISIVICIYSIMFLAFFIGFPDMFPLDQNKDWNEFKNIALENMDCYSLKNTLLDVEKSEFDFKNIPDDIKSQILVRCLK